LEVFLRIMLTGNEVKACGACVMCLATRVPMGSHAMQKQKASRES
jgi:hypothetical protein